MSADEVARLRNAHLVHLADLEDLRREYVKGRNGAAANAVVECMRRARRWAERAGISKSVDIDVSRPAADTQFGDL